MPKADSSNIAAFTAAALATVKKAEIRFNKTLHDIAVKAHRVVIELTPDDLIESGAFRASWTVAVNAVDTTRISDSERSAALRTDQQIPPPSLAETEAAVGEPVAGDDIIINNSMVYVLDAGMARKAALVDQAVASVEAFAQALAEGLSTEEIV